jgi:hypothetical protein
MQRWSIDSDAWLDYKDEAGLYVRYWDADYEIKKLKEERDEVREQLVGICQDIIQGDKYSALATATRFLAELDAYGGMNKL